MSWLLDFTKEATRWFALVVALIAVNVLFVWLLFRVFAKPQPPLGPDWVGETGTAITKVSRLEGKIRVRNRVVIAIADDPIEPGRAVKVVQVEGLVAKVVAAQEGIRAT